MLNRAVSGSKFAFVPTFESVRGFLTGHNWPLKSKENNWI